MDRIAASFASGDPVASETRDESDLRPRSFADSCMNLYNQIQATICPAMEPNAIQTIEYPIVKVNPMKPMNMYPEFQVLTADKAANAGCIPLPATR